MFTICLAFHIFGFLSIHRSIENQVLAVDVGVLGNLREKRRKICFKGYLVNISMYGFNEKFLARIVL